MFVFSLECNEECRVLERNKRLAIGLQIRNPDLSSKLTPRYSDFMRLWAKKDQYFCQMVHDKLSELVQLAKQVCFIFSIYFKIYRTPNKTREFIIIISYCSLKEIKEPEVIIKYQTK